MNMENPANYKKIEDMPKKMQDKYEEVEEGGFIEKNAVEEQQIADLVAMLENQENYEKEAEKSISARTKKAINELTGKDVMQIEAKEINEMRDGMLALFDEGDKKEFAEMVEKTYNMFQNDKEMMVRYVEASPDKYKDLPNNMKDVDKITLKAIEMRGENILQAPVRFKKDKAAVLMAAKGMPYNAQDLFKDDVISGEFGKDFEVASALVRTTHSKMGNYNGSNIKDVLANANPYLSRLVEMRRQKMKDAK